MPGSDEIDDDKGSSSQKPIATLAWINDRKEISEAKQLARCYQKAMNKFSDIVRRDLCDQLEDRSIGTDISALLYKGAIRELSKAAAHSIGEQKTRSLLRQISEELRS